MTVQDLERIEKQCETFRGTLEAMHGDAVRRRDVTAEITYGVGEGYLRQIRQALSDLIAKMRQEQGIGAAAVGNTLNYCLRPEPELTPGISPGVSEIDNDDDDEPTFILEHLSDSELENLQDHYEALARFLARAADHFECE